MDSSASPDHNLYHYSLAALFLIGPPTVICLRFIQAPYGKHLRAGWGPSLPPRLAWLLMESPTLILPLLLPLLPIPSRHLFEPRSLALLSPFLLHYLHRTLIYPLRLPPSSPAKRAATFPLAVASMGFAFNLLNAYVQTRFVMHYKDYDSDRFFWARFAAGLGLFVFGMAVNVRSDRALVRLKEKAKGGYGVPRGGWFELVSCPNYFGEIVEWLGWAVMTWHLAGLSFFLYTCANLVPRAHASHRWYLDKFGEDYPKGRKAVIPFLY